MPSLPSLSPLYVFILLILLIVLPNPSTSLSTPTSSPPTLKPSIETVLKKEVSWGGRDRRMERRGESWIEGGKDGAKEGRLECSDRLETGVKERMLSFQPCSSLVLVGC